MHVRKPQYVERLIASFLKLFDIHIFLVHDYQLCKCHGGQLSLQIGAFFSFSKLQVKYINIIWCYRRVLQSKLICLRNRIKETSAECCGNDPWPNRLLSARAMKTNHGLGSLHLDSEKPLTFHRGSHHPSTHVLNASQLRTALPENAQPKLGFLSRDTGPSQEAQAKEAPHRPRRAVLTPPLQGLP